jgi:hypothetical protein
MSVCIVGSSSSIINLPEICSSTNTVYGISSKKSFESENFKHISIDWSEGLLPSHLEIKSRSIETLVFANGLWLPGRIKKFSQEKFVTLYEANCQVTYNLLKQLKSQDLLHENCTVKLISSDSVTKVDTSAPEYSLSKAMAESLISEFCKAQNINFKCQRFGFVEGSSMLKKFEERYGMLKSSCKVNDITSFIRN